MSPKRPAEDLLNRIHTIIVVSLSLLALCFGLFCFVFFTFGAIDCHEPTKVVPFETGQLSNLVEAYYLSSTPRVLPNRLEDLAAGPSPLTKEIQKDPWGNDYIYRKTSTKGFDIFSAGRDGIEGNEDDIGVDGQRKHTKQRPSSDLVAQLAKAVRWTE